MLVVDLDGDGRNDIIWGHGHNYGLYWEERRDDNKDGTTNWRHHLIDDRFSQPHVLVWEDIDNDGQPELITGRRARPTAATIPATTSPAASTTSSGTGRRRSSKSSPSPRTAPASGCRSAWPISMATAGRISSPRGRAGLTSSGTLENEVLTGKARQRQPGRIFLAKHVGCLPQKTGHVRRRGAHGCPTALAAEGAARRRPDASVRPDGAGSFDCLAGAGHGRVGGGVGHRLGDVLDGGMLCVRLVAQAGAVCRVRLLGPAGGPRRCVRQRVVV